MFKKFRTVELPYNKQGYIWFALHNFNLLPPDKQRKIIMLAFEIARNDRFPEFFELLTGNGDIRYLQRKYHFENSTRFYNMRKKFYERYFAEVEI